ncbi:hypothetical protein PF003_g17890 [Phytophthora fragariae]|nr:hypothetical protein PF003_g17890 [Phytophthora fragariae]
MTTRGCAFAVATAALVGLLQHCGSSNACSAGMGGGEAAEGPGGPPDHHHETLRWSTPSPTRVGDPPRETNIYASGQWQVLQCVQSSSSSWRAILRRPHTAALMLFSSAPALCTPRSVRTAVLAAKFAARNAGAGDTLLVQ